MKTTQKIKFGKEKEDIDTLAGKVLSGEKTATSSLLDYYRLDLKKMSKTGDYISILDAADKEVAIVKVKKIEIVRMKDIDESFAIEEGDGSLDNWLDIHTKYYSEQLSNIGKKLSGDTELVCEWFEVIRR